MARGSQCRSVPRECVARVHCVPKVVHGRVQRVPAAFPDLAPWCRNRPHLIRSSAYDLHMENVARAVRTVRGQAATPGYPPPLVFAIRTELLIVAIFRMPFLVRKAGASKWTGGGAITVNKIVPCYGVLTISCDRGLVPLILYYGNRQFVLSYSAPGKTTKGPNHFQVYLA